MIGIILAGGKSSRFGEDKSLYKLNGMPMYEHVAQKLKNVQAIDEIVINTNDKLKTSFKNYKVIVDDPDYIDHGPLGGLYAAAKEYPGEPLMVISCDTPYVDSAWLNILAEKAEESGNTTITTDNDREHPLIGVYQHDTLAELLKGQLETKRLSLKAFFENLNVDYINIESYNLNSTTLVNINRKTDIK